ncbi:MAG: glycosyltransferase family 2 protein [Rubripirellula sp.]
MQRPEFISVILSTYNAPEWLEKVLWGYSLQSHRQFEIVIADDGSNDQTADLISQMRDQTDLVLKHVWHEDDGFQKCAIMNRAIESAAGDYMVFSDGDCIPRSDFVRQHYAAAEPGRFLSGGYYKLPLALSELISEHDIRSGRAFSVSWLRANGLPFSHRLLRLLPHGWQSGLLNRITTTRATWNGNNASGWADDIRQANGFDERMRYGGEDRELGERLENAGIRGKHIRFQSVCLHLDHPRGYVNDVDLQRNLEIRHATQQAKRTQTEHGLRRAA